MEGRPEGWPLLPPSSSTIVGGALEAADRPLHREFVEVLTDFSPFCALHSPFRPTSIYVTAIDYHEAHATPTIGASPP